MNRMESDLLPSSLGRHVHFLRGRGMLTPICSLQPSGSLPGWGGAEWQQEP